MDVQYIVTTFRRPNNFFIGPNKYGSSFFIEFSLIIMVMMMMIATAKIGCLTHFFLSSKNIVTLSILLNSATEQLNGFPAARCGLTVTTAL